MEIETEVQELVDRDLLPGHLAHKLAQLGPGVCCSHRSWGIGQIKEWNEALGQVVIDFRGKPGHGMAFEYATESLTPLAADHIQSKICTQLEAVKGLVESDVLELMKIVVKSLGNDATAERIEPVLSPIVVPQDKWKKFWDGAKRVMKKDAHFDVPSRRTELIIFHDSPPDLTVQLVNAYKNTKALKPKVTALDQVVKEWKDIDNLDVAKELIVDASQVALKIPRSQVGVGLELALATDELADVAGMEDRASSLEALLPKENMTKLGALIGLLPSVKQGRILERARKFLGEGWQEQFLELLPTANAKIAQGVIEAFQDEEREEEVLFTIQRLIRERNMSPDFMVYVCKNRKGIFDKLIDSQFIFAVLSALEMDQMGGTKKATRLYDLLLTDKEAVKDLLSKSSDEEIRDITRAILLSPAFEELDKRSLLAQFVKLYPFVQGMIIGDQEAAKQAKGDSDETPTTLIVSWESLEERKKELDEIINVKMPQNRKDIEIARSYGDLRENHEFKAAKEMKAILERRRSELEVMLTQAQGTDFKDVDTSEVNIGTTVELFDVNADQKVLYTILGAWDSDLKNNIISYLTPVAQSLLKKPVGTEVELKEEDGSARMVRIESIRNFEKAS